MRARSAASAALVLLAVLLLAISAALPRAEAPTNERVALIVAIEGAIGPATTRHVGIALETAAERGAELVVLRLNTPGGLATSMRDIIAEVLASQVPVIGYVAPPGAHAASAGTYILYATSIAAMAPGTNVGAATPVQLGGLPGMPEPSKPAPDKPDGEAKPGDDEPSEPAPEAAPEPADDPSKAKAVNDAVAYIRSLAEMRGRNAEWAEKAVREAATLSAGQALKQGVIDLVAGDVAELLGALDGRTAPVRGGERVLDTEGLAVEEVEADFLTRALGVLSNPNVALILMMIGVYGLIFELANPGSIGPGVIGTICLLLGLYALNQLPLDYAGLALLVLGIALMVAEGFTPSVGVLGVGGLAAFIIGAAILVESPVPAFQLSWTVIIGTALVSAALLTLLLGYVWRAHRHAVVTGREGLAGSRAEVLDWQDGRGHVWAEGERWSACGEGAIAPGRTVRVLRHEGLVLVVAAEPEAPTD